MAHHASRSNPKYVYDLPYFERMELCRILDQNDKWEELGGIYMHFDVLTIQTLRREILRGNSPADELLTQWGHQNHTILELFVLLSKMQHYQAMLTIKQFVDPEYHRLIYEGEQNLIRLMQSRCPKNRNALDVSDQTISPGICSRVPQAHTPLRLNETVNMPAKDRDNAPERSQIQNKLEIKNNERKILNNEGIFQPGKSGAEKNNAREENAGGNNDGTSLSRPRLLKGESTKDKNLSEISSIAESVGILPLITFKDLEIATNGWDQSAILGKGGFGTVYKGMWKNTQVAIKRTKNSDTDQNRTAQIQQLLGELKMLNSYRHDNILPLYGFSLGAEEPCLVYQYMPNGSLEDRLLCRNGTKPLSWFQRHNIAIGTARGLQFLHTTGEKPLVHGDIKSANILLDTNFEPKIGDFGLAREGPYSHYTHMKVSKVHGTRPYLPDEFLRHKKFSTKVDTHSFGIVLFELATGLRAYDDQRQQKFLKDLIENSAEQELGLLMDRKCGLDEHQTFPNLIALGKRCASRKAKERPEMVTVLQELNAMAVKRDTFVKVQNLMRQNSVSPLNPFEVQIIHDHLSQQKRISPVPSVSAMHRAVSPLQQTFPHPETNRAISPIVNEPHSPIIFHPPDAVRMESPVQRKDIRSISPTISPSHPPDIDEKQESRLLAQKPKRANILQEVRPLPPVISVSPPSAPQTSPITTEEISSEEQQLNSHVGVSQIQLVKDNTNRTLTSKFSQDYSYSSELENFLPLISELGIKSKSSKNLEEKVQQSPNEQVPDVRTSATGKTLWILNDSS